MNNDNGPKFKLISVEQPKERDLTSEGVMEEVRDAIGGADGFILIPVALVEYNDSTGLEAEVKMYDRLTDGDPEFLEGIYMAALGALYANICDRYDPQMVVRYLISLTPNPNAKKH